jgi:hypothetical protein
MSSAIFKVLFEGYEGYENESITLSFKSLILNKYITVPTDILFDLKNLHLKSKNVFAFQNITEVVFIGDIDKKFNYYIVILIISEKDVKEGYLIGNIKKIGDVVIGIWPFTIQSEQFSQERIIDKLRYIIDKPDKFKKINIIYSR